MQLTTIEGEIRQWKMDLEARDRALDGVVESKEQRMQSHFANLIVIFKHTPILLVYRLM